MRKDYHYYYYYYYKHDGDDDDDDGKDDNDEGDCAHSDEENKSEAESETNQEECDIVPSKWIGYVPEPLKYEDAKVQTWCIVDYKGSYFLGYILRKDDASRTAQVQVQGSRPKKIHHPGDFFQQFVEI